MDKHENSFKVTGFIYKILPEMKFESGFTKRDFVLETREHGKDGKTYKNLTRFETVKSFAAYLDNLGVNSEVTVSFSLAGREWENKKTKEVIIINALRCWKIEVIENTNQDIKSTEKDVKEEVPEFEDSGLPF